MHVGGERAMNMAQQPQVSAADSGEPNFGAGVLRGVSQEEGHAMSGPAASQDGNLLVDNRHHALHFLGPALTSPSLFTGGWCSLLNPCSHRLFPTQLVVMIFISGGD